MIECSFQNVIEQLFRDAGNDVLKGQAGDDSLSGSFGNDTLDGGEDLDLLIELANANLTLTDDRLTGVGNDVLADIESANLSGGKGKNTLNAAAFTLGSVTLIGAAGNDSLIGGAANDSLDGGPGTTR